MQRDKGGDNLDNATIYQQEDVTITNTTMQKRLHSSDGLGGLILTFQESFAIVTRVEFARGVMNPQGLAIFMITVLSLRMHVKELVK